MQIIIDTNLYAGNFEREMCATLTGHCGECGVGAEEASETFLDMSDDVKGWWTNNIGSVYDGCWRPVGITGTPGYFNHGMGGEYLDTPENRIIALVDYNQKIRDYNELHPTANMKEKDEVSIWPACLSVAIEVDAKVIPSWIIDDMTARLTEYVLHYHTSGKSYQNRKKMELLDIRYDFS